MGEEFDARETEIHAAPLTDRLRGIMVRVQAMIDEERSPKMSIPARPQDDDLFIHRVVHDAIGEISRLRNQAEKAERERDRFTIRDTDGRIVSQEVFDALVASLAAAYDRGDKAELERDDLRWRLPPCLECGAETKEEAELKCRCGGDKDDCHGLHLWPDA